MIDLILYLIMSLITLLVLLFSFKKITSEELKVNKKIIIILILGSVVPPLFQYLNLAIIKTILTFLTIVMLFKASSSKSIYELSCYAVVLWLYGMLLDLLIMLIVSLTGISKLVNENNIIYIQTLSSIIQTSLIYITCSLNYIKRIIKNAVKKILKIKLSYLFEIVIIMLLTIIGILCATNVTKISLIITYVVIAILLLYAIIITLEKNYNIKKLKSINHILIKNNEFFIKLDSDYRILKHNLINQLTGIKSIANDKTKVLIDELIVSYNENYNPPKDISKIPEGINGIVYEKFYEYNKNDINLAVENSIFSDVLDVIKPRVFNTLCETLGVLIDNALEAAYNSEEKSILIDFSENDENIYINIFNTFSANIDIDKLGEKSYSTKGKKRGIGLFSIFQKKDIRVKNSILNNLFKTELKIKKQKY